MHYEMYMRAALSEASQAAAAGELADGAVAVLDEAMVAHGRAQVRALGDPTAHAVIGVLREAARRLGRPSLTGVTVFCTVEPCIMCVGALLESDADGLVYALADPLGAAGSLIQLADSDLLPRRLRIVSGILQEEAADLRPDLREGRPAAFPGFARAR
ncbi:MAG: nucleoside deaminase [Chloroflexota bacterium]|nr:nucleoside deaminase [Chloroflexota bacterium]